jgi:hypothetical protein
VLALEFIQTTLPSIARRKRGTVEWLGEHERLVFADTRMSVMAWESIGRTLDGVRRAIAHIEQQPGAPKSLLNDLRGLVASAGAGKPRW